MTLHPAPLRAGDAVALICPAAPVPHDRLDLAVGVLASWGLDVRVAPHVRLKHDTYLAGTDEQRLGDLNAALGDPEIRGVIAVRGGYGMQRIVDRVDFDAVRRDPKLVMGFSDITSLHLALWAETGLATVLGPVAAQFDKGADAPTTLSARRSLMSVEPVEVKADPAESTVSVRVGGVATGTLVGGNLCLIDSTIGTRHLPSLDGAILLMEEVNEVPYRIDRMLTHLLRSGVLDRVAGVAVGQFTGCVDAWPITAPEVISERLGGLGVPVLGGLPIGHGLHNIAIGHGVEATLDADAGTLTVAPATRA